MRWSRWSLGFLGLCLWCAGCGDGSGPPGPALPYAPSAPRPAGDVTQEPLADDVPRVLLQTTQGDLELALFEDEVPNTVAYFVQLVEQKFYDGQKFCRLVPDRVLEGGDPRGDGTGHAGFLAPFERYDRHRRNVYGTLALLPLKDDPDNNLGCRLGFNLAKTPSGNPDYDTDRVVVGKVVKGLEVLEKLAAVKTDAKNEPVEEQKILRAVVLRKRPHPYRAPVQLPAPVAPVAAPAGPVAPN